MMSDLTVSELAIIEEGLKLRLSEMTQQYHHLIGRGFHLKAKEIWRFRKQTLALRNKVHEHRDSC